MSGVHNVFHISMLKEYHQGATPHVIEFQEIEVNKRESYTESLVRILGREMKKLRNKEIHLVKVQWKHHNDRKASWETKSEIREKYPELFQD